MTRLERIQKTAEEILSPVMVEFVKWMLREANERGIRRIYFLARDGWPMYQTARILTEGSSCGIQCRYLECSRFSLRVPAFWLMGSNLADQIFLEGPGLTLRKILQRAALLEDEIQELSAELDTDDMLNTRLSYDDIRKLKTRFRNSTRFLQLAEAHSRKAYETAAGYLRQEGLLEPVKWAVADSGWIGSMQQTLQLLLRSMGDYRKLTGFYFGLYQLPAMAREADYHAYYFSPKGNLRRKVWFSNSLFECVFSSASGSTLGYQLKNGVYCPIYGVCRKQNSEELQIIQKAIEARARKERNQLPETLWFWKPESAEKAEKRLKLFMGKPEMEEAEAFGNWYFSHDVLENPLQTLVSSSDGKICRNSIRASAWPEGSVRISGGHFWRFWMVRLYKYARFFRIWGKEILHR